MNSLEFAPVSRLLPSPHELQVRLDSLRKLSNDCRTIVDEAPFSQERKEYISMLIEEKITFAEHLSGIEGSSIYLKRLLENLLRLQEV